MSNDFYNQLWHDTQRDVRKTIDRERALRRKGPNPNVDKAKWLVGHLYTGYVSVVNRLDMCYDQITHPQKREVIARLLDTTLGRLIEMKNDIVRLELDDYTYFDNILIELHMTHEDLEVKVPQHFWRDRQAAREHRRGLIKEAIEEVRKEQFKIQYLSKIPEEEREDRWAAYEAAQEAARQQREAERELKRRRGYVSPPPEPELGPNELRLSDAMVIIQKHERARQSHGAVHEAVWKRHLKFTGRRPRKIPEQTKYLAARVIQRHWRRHWGRVLAQRREQRLMLMMNITQPSYKDRSAYRAIQETIQARRKVQERNQAEYEQGILEMREYVKRYAPQMAEDTADEIRAWIENFYRETEALPPFPPPWPELPTGEIMGIPKGISPEFIAKFFPYSVKQDFPSTALGIALSGLTEIQGTALIVAGHWITPTEFLGCQMELERIKKAGKGNENKPSKEELKEKAAQEKARLKRLQEAEEALGFQLKPSNFTRPLLKADKDYRDNWLNRDESHNYHQRYIKEIVHDEEVFQLAVEIRKVVDELMFLELEQLDMAMQRDKNPKKKPKRLKPPKPKKPKKPKKVKDPTADRTPDDLFKELYLNGVIREYEEAHLADYMGERSLTAFEYRQAMGDPLPATGDVREVVLQYCILPLGSARVHQLVPLLKSVCLLGPEKGGKEFLARIVCTETASVMFDLTPANIRGRYPGAKGVKMLQHLVEKMSRLLQPSVVFVDGAEKTFYKKVPKEEKDDDPKKLKGALPKIVKGIKPEDQVLVLGVSSFPWLCPPAKIVKTYEKILYVPSPDYGTYFKLWKDLLTPYHSLPREFDFSALAKVSAGYSIKFIMEVVEQTLRAEKVCRNRLWPYKETDFIEVMALTDPTPPESVAKCVKFMQKTPMGKKRIARIEEAQLLASKTKK